MRAQQPEALRLADWLEDQYDPTHHQEMSAAELRRLHALNADLLHALTRICALPVHADAIRMAHKHAEEAIAKAANNAK